MKRVLYVSHEPECGGAELSLLDLMGGLTEYTPVLACSGPGPLPDEARKRDIEVHTVTMRFESKLSKLIGIRAAARALADLVRAQDIAIVHANTLIAGYCALGACRRAGVPLIWHVRDLGYPALGRWACGKADHVIANSKATAKSLGSGIDAHVIYNGVAHRFFRAAQGRPRARSPVVVGMAGRIDPWKGHEDMMGAAAIVSDVLFRVAGGALFGKGEAYLESLRSTGLPNVEFLGPVSDMPQFMADIDILVHPSREPEPFGRTVAEAMMSGLPVVATNHGGLPEVVNYKGLSGGFLVPPRDPEALAARIRELVDHPSLREELGEKARLMALDRFQVDDHVDAVQAIYDSV